MRGVAVLSAMGAVWVLTGGAVPTMTGQRPSLNLRLLPLGLVSGLLVFLLTFGVVGITVPAAAFGVLGISIPFQITGSRMRKRQSAASGAWPDLIAHIRSSVAAGLTLPDAYVDAAQRVGEPFSRTLDEVRRQLLFGAGFAEAMKILRDDARDPTADRVTTTLTVANETGGPRVGEVLSMLSASVAGESRLRSAHEAAMTEQRWTAGVALSAPWAILALSIATNPQASRAYGTTTGGVVIGIGLAMTIGGYLLSRKLAALSDAPRMFRA